MKASVEVEVSVTNENLLKEVEKRLGIDHFYMYLNKKDGRVWSDERYDHETTVDPELFSAFCTIHDYLNRTGKYKNRK